MRIRIFAKRASAFVLGTAVGIGLFFALREAAGYALEAYLRGYMEDHKDEIRELVKEGRCKRECEMVCMGGGVER